MAARTGPAAQEGPLPEDNPMGRDTETNLAKPLGREGAENGVRHEELKGSKSTPCSPSGSPTSWELIVPVPAGLCSRAVPPAAASQTSPCSKRLSCTLLPSVGLPAQITTTESLKLNLGLLQYSNTWNTGPRLGQPACLEWGRGWGRKTKSPNHLLCS